MLDACKRESLASFKDDRSVHTCTLHSFEAHHSACLPRCSAACCWSGTSSVRATLSSKCLLTSTAMRYALRSLGRFLVLPSRLSGAFLFAM